MELIPILGNTYGYRIANSMIGVYLPDDRHAILIDSGSRRSPELLRDLAEAGLTVSTVISTHLHVDHIANNPALIAAYGCPIWACDREPEDVEFCRIHLEYPLSLNVPDGEICIGGSKFRTVYTPGHTSGHQMIVTPDDVCFIGDVIMSADTLAEAKMPYFRDVTRSILSMEILRETHFTAYAAAHLGVIPAERLSDVIDANIQKELELYDILRSIITEPIPEEELRLKFMHACGITSPKMTGIYFMQVSSGARINELVFAGELLREGDLILPGSSRS